MYSSLIKPHFVVSQVKTESAAEKCGFEVKWVINPHMKVGKTSLTEAVRQHWDFVHTLKNCGAEALPVPYVCRAYDSVFMKDNAILINSSSGFKALMSRPARPERAIEPLVRTSQLQALGFSIYGQSREPLEGGDVVVSPHGDFAFLGYGFRSTEAAVTEVEAFLKLPVFPLQLVDPHFYHLDTALNCTMTAKGCVVLAYEGAFSPESWRLIRSRPEIAQVIRIDRDEAMNFALNWVEINGTIVVGGKSPATQAILEKLGKTVVVRPLDQFKMAGGSAACLVAQIHELKSQGH